MVRFFKMFKNLSQILKSLENFGDFAQNWANGYMNGSLFHEKLVFVWVFFQILQWHIPTKTKLEYPPPPRVDEEGEIVI